MSMIGFIGLGVMGAPMAHNLLDAGHDLVVYNRSTAKTERLVAAGATAATSPAEVTGRTEMVLTCLGDDRDVGEVVFDQILPATRAGQLLIDFTTSAPALAREIATSAAERGVDSLDAPVSGGQVGAQDATLAIMVGGNDAAFERAAPLLHHLGTPTYVGPAGAGHVAKAANQIIVGATIAAVAEALLLAERASVDPAAVRTALAGGFADSRILDIHGQRMLDSAFEPGFRAELHRKDLRLALDLARETATALPATSIVAQLLTGLVGAGDGGRDHAALQLALRRLVGEQPAP
jgi:2-hydroxy-3-oxopropionate reductase